MSAPDRRRAIVEAVTPLIMERGVSATTADLARAAGIAEGTIFGVFPDKDALIHEVVTAALDPRDTIGALSEIGSNVGLRDALDQASSALSARDRRIHDLMSVLPSFRASARQRKDVRTAALEANSEIYEALTGLFARYSDKLTVTPGAAAAALRGLLFALHSPFTPESERLTEAEALTIFVHGTHKEFKQ